MKRSELQRKTPLRSRSYLRPKPALKRTYIPPRKGGISPASPAQRAKAKAGFCIVSGATEGVDPAHLWSRGRGGCDSPDCVVLLRRDLHQQFDHGELDILPYLIAQGCWVELAHAVSTHQVDPISLLQRVTGERWVPESEQEAA